jgi:hypothetical protein
MSQRETILTPIGRLVQGSLYKANTTDAEGRPLVTKTGANAGKPRTDYYFGLAVKKGTETHWSQTEWGAIIWAVGHAAFPNGQAQAPTFAWKITDGDSTVHNKAGKRPCDKEGYAGHWVLNFTCGFAPPIYTADGTGQIFEENFVNLGDFIQVAGSVSGNESLQQPGIYLNHNMVAFAAYGTRIILGPDAKSVGFGQSPLPAGASLVPLSQGFNPAPVANVPPPVAVMPAPVANVPPPVAVVSAPPAPYTAILNTPIAPPAPAVLVRAMTEKAAGLTYEQYIANGWTDVLLIQHGYMLA